MRINLNGLEYRAMTFCQPCGESSFGLANHAGCGNNTPMAIVITDGLVMEREIYIFCCRCCLDQYIQFQ